MPRYSSQVLSKLGISRQIFEKYSKTKFHENASSESGVVPSYRRTDKQADMTQLIVAFINLANAPDISGSYTYF
jgi:hypothetical protein